MEICENCGRSIGNLETPHLHNGRVVCSGCAEKLEVEIPYATPAPQPMSGPAMVPCPICNHAISARAIVCPSCGHPVGWDARRQRLAKARRGDMRLGLALIAVGLPTF